MGGISVQTGDLLVADADGVVVIARADAKRVITAGIQREKEEFAIIERLAKGERTLDIYQLPLQA
jgi:4-hydroxy-4-methyl-2-oxoglutarate aldolase